MQKSLVALATFGWALAACSDNVAPTYVESSPEPEFVAAARGGRPDLTGRFIVTLAERTTPVAVAREYGVQPDFVYNHAQRPLGRQPVARRPGE